MSGETARGDQSGEWGTNQPHLARFWAWLELVSGTLGGGLAQQGESGSPDPP